MGSMSSSSAAATWPPKSWNGEGEYATIAGGCFWSVELMATRIPGVLYACSGYIGGSTDNPTYRDICSGQSGHAEAVQVIFNPAKCSYQTILEAFMKHHDPTQLNRQGNDRGTQYRSAIFYHSEEQRKIAEDIVANTSRNGKKAVTQVESAGAFWPAEEYHQKYLENGGRFGKPQSARKGCTDPIRCYG